MWIVVEVDGCGLASKCPVKRQKIESYSACGPCCGTVISGYVSADALRQCIEGVVTAEHASHAAEGIHDEITVRRIQWHHRGNMWSDSVQLVQDP